MRGIISFIVNNYYLILIIFQMEANPASEIGEVLSRIAQLQRLKREIVALQRLASEQLETAARLGRECGAPEPALLERAEAAHDRLDALLAILDVQADRVSALATRSAFTTQCHLACTLVYLLLLF